MGAAFKGFVIVALFGAFACGLSFVVGVGIGFSGGVAASVAGVMP